MKKKVLLIITGSVASYKSMDLLRLLTKKSLAKKSLAKESFAKESFSVTCVLTKAAQQFITPLLASSLSGNKTYNELFDANDALGIDHIALSRQNDLIIVAPATADFIAKIAGGYADDLASNIILASNKKIILAPAMNEKMWDNKATQTNLEKVLQAGISIVAPESDILACGELGVGKMSSPEKICEKVCDFFAHQNLLKGKKIVITGGSTYEPIDPVRFIGNHSSGKQAIEIAKVLNEMGADVTMIAGNIRETIYLPKEKIIRVKTAAEMFEMVKKTLSSTAVILGRDSIRGSHEIGSEVKLMRSSGAKAPKDDENLIDVFIGCAAVSDFKVKKISNEKIKKSADGKLTLELEKNPDILQFVGTSKQRPKLVIGFAAESENLKKYAGEKLKKKNCDLVVANDIEAGKIFGSNFTKAFFVTAKKTEDLGKISKSELAKLLAEKIIDF